MSYYNRSYTVAEEPLNDPDLDPGEDRTTCCKCDLMADFVYDGSPFCEAHCPNREAATRLI